MADVVPRKNKGRQKVKMQRMEKDSNRQVTFSKRRCGLFKKASELSTLCGAEVAIIVFSPGQKAYSFGHPCVETIINRFLDENPLPKDKIERKIEPVTYPYVNFHDLNMDITRINSRLEDEKTRGTKLNEMRKAREDIYWWDVPVEKLELQDLEVLKASLEELKKKVYQHGNVIMIEPSNSSINNDGNIMGMINPIIGFNPDNNPAFFNPNNFGLVGYQHAINYQL